MSLFAKLFGNSKSKSEPLSVPTHASAIEIIDIAVQSVIQQAGGNCATIEVVSEPKKWLQIMDLTINCHYPHKANPETLFPELLNHPNVAGLEDYQDGLSITVSLNEMNPSEITDWVQSYFSRVLSVDLPSNPIRLKMEEF